MKKKLSSSMKKKIGVPKWALIAIVTLSVVLVLFLVAMQSAADAHASERAYAIRTSYITMPPQELRTIAMNSIIYDISQSMRVVIIILALGLMGGLWNGLRFVNVSVNHEHEHHHYEQRQKHEEKKWWHFGRD